MLLSRQKIFYLMVMVFIYIVFYFEYSRNIRVNLKNFLAREIVDFSLLNNITGCYYPIVPNIVHYVQFGKRDINFIQAVSIKSVFLNHRPEKIIIHCDCHSISGKYWNFVKNISNLEVRFMSRPTHVFGRPLSSVYHSSDIARLKILMDEGGIFLDGDSYVVKSLDYYRRFEMTLGWPPGQNLGTQVLIAHKNARFLKLWYNSYKYYRRERWYYNAGELPTKFILEPNPGLVHRVSYDFGVHNLVHLLYGVRSDNWQNYNCIHLLVRHKNYLLPGDSILEFDAENIKHYNKTFGDMARLVIYGTSDFID